MPKRRGFNRKRKYSRLKLVFAVFIFLTLAVFGLYKMQPKLWNEWQKKFSEHKNNQTENNQLTIKKAIVPVISESPLNKDLILKHRIAARFNGVKRMDDFAEMNAQVAEGKLVSVHDAKGLIIGEMTHSFPYLTPKAKEILEQIGYSFYTFSGDSSAFTVTSLTRTEETQEKLRKRNSNATKEESTHCFGVSFDISYIRYNGFKEWNVERTKTLESVLAAMQERGYIYVIKERKQSCFHITVRK